MPQTHRHTYPPDLRSPKTAPWSSEATSACQQHQGWLEPDQDQHKQSQPDQVQGKQSHPMDRSPASAFLTSCASTPRPHVPVQRGGAAQATPKLASPARAHDLCADNTSGRAMGIGPPGHRPKHRLHPRDRPIPKAPLGVRTVRPPPILRPAQTQATHAVQESPLPQHVDETERSPHGTWPRCRRRTHGSTLRCFSGWLHHKRVDQNTLHEGVPIIMRGPIPNGA
mmetsp:Transcript_7296/g.15815  ORF Transcript_7296/g.15815 Transcript_7296/m.15815 type:complete len:225 (+) Transcript_7296:126-800(+)